MRFRDSAINVAGRESRVRTYHQGAKTDRESGFAPGKSVLRKMGILPTRSRPQADHRDYLAELPPVQDVSHTPGVGFTMREDGATEKWAAVSAMGPVIPDAPAVGSSLREKNPRKFGGALLASYGGTIAPHSQLPPKEQNKSPMIRLDAASLVAHVHL